MIEILTTGMLNTVQDRGRRGWLDIGVGHGGAMDRLALDMGNALLGNPPDAAGIEVVIFPFRLRFGADAIFAVTGADCAATLDGVPLPPDWRQGARAGQVLALAPPRRGARGYVTFAGGIDVPEVLGARATDLKNGFGGLEGRGLRRGDRLALGADGRPLGRGPMNGGVGFGALRGDPLPAPGARVELRVIPAAEHACFTRAAHALFRDSDWEVTAEANRMGYRLAGPALALERPLELLSHGILPGVVQVPPSGQPIVQLADANTCGGYPKIAAVIAPDLWRIAQAPVGARLRFVETSRAAARDTMRAEAALLADLRATAALIADA